MNKQARLGILYAFLAYFAWGLLAPVGKILLAEFPAFTLNAWRMTFATIMLLPLVPWHKWREGLRYTQRQEVFVLAIIGGGIDFTLYLMALTLLPATFATLGFYTAPLWTAVLARIRLGEKVGWSFAPAIAVMGLGAWLFLIRGAPAGDFHAGGFAVAVLSGVGWAVYAVGLRQYAPNLGLRPLMVASFVVSTAYFWFGAWLIDGLYIPQVSHATWGWMLLHAAIPTTLALFLFNASLQRAPAGVVNVLVGVELAATALFAWLIIDDTFSVLQLVGLALVIVSVSVYLWVRSRQGRRPRVPARAD